MIAVPQDADRLVTFAAGELRRYLEMTGGADVPIVTAPLRPAGRPALCVGVGAHPTPIAFPDDALPQSFRIKSVGDDIVLSGADTIGSCNAVFHFIETQLGVRWYMPFALWEYIPPRRTSIEIARLDVLEAPSFAQRDPKYVWGNWVTLEQRRDYDLWRLRNRCVTHWVGRAGHIYTAWMRGTSIEEHPDCFALYYKDTHPQHATGTSADTRKRMAESGSPVRTPAQVCNSNPAVLEAAVAHSIEALKTDEVLMPGILDYARKLTMVPSSANDNYDFCDCDRCRALDAEPRRHRNGLGPVVSDRVFHTAAELAGRMAKEAPGTFVGCLAYGLYDEPPRRYARLPDNMVVVLSTRGEVADAWIQSGLTRNLFFHRVLPGYNTPHARNLAGECQKEYREYRARGVTGGFTVETVNSWGVHGWDTYQIARLMWNADTDLDGLEEEFCRNMFGKAATPMRHFWKTCAALSGQGLWFDHYRPESCALIAEAGRHIDAAARLAAADADPRVLERVEFLRRSFVYGRDLWELVHLTVYAADGGWYPLSFGGGPSPFDHLKRTYGDRYEEARRAAVADRSLWHLDWADGRLPSVPAGLSEKEFVRFRINALWEDMQKIRQSMPYENAIEFRVVDQRWPVIQRLILPRLNSQK